MPTKLVDHLSPYVCIAFKSICKSSPKKITATQMQGVGERKRREGGDLNNGEVGISEVVNYILLMAESRA